MAIPYLNIARAVALRSGQLSDAATAAAFEAVYTGSLASALGGFEIPFSELKRLVIAAEKRIASICVRQPNPVLKLGLMDRSADLATGAAIPLVDNDADEWIGSFDAVFDAVTAQPLSEKPKQYIFACNRRYAAGELRIRPFHFCFEPGILHHTRASAYIQGAAWDQATQETAYGAGGNSPLSQEVETWWVAESCANAAQEGWFVQEAGAYSQIAKACHEDAVKGVIPTAFLPDTTASVEPVKN